MEGEEDVQIKLTRKYVKMKIMRDNITFRGYEKQKQHVFDLLSRTVEVGESNSALIIGPRGCGKTTVRLFVLPNRSKASQHGRLFDFQMIENALWKLYKKPTFAQNSILVRLNGLLHTDDKLSLKAITTQVITFEIDVCRYLH